MASIAAQFATRGKKCVAIGRNYLDHVKELNNAIPTEPFFFLKPTSSYIFNKQAVKIPQGVTAHFEVELGVVIGSKATSVPSSKAFEHVAGYTLAIDMTARNVQDHIKKKGLPWSTAKGFDTFCPVGDFLPKEAVKDPHALSLWLKVNNAFKQNGTTSDMIFRIPQLIEHVSGIMTLEEGDLLLTGTPAGVGPVQAGDVITAGLEQEGQRFLGLAVGVEDRKDGYRFSAS